MSEAAPQSPISTKRLSKVPVFIFAATIIAVGAVVFYSLAEQEKQKQQEPTEKPLVQATQDDADTSMQSILKRKNHRPAPDENNEESNNTTIVYTEPARSAMGNSQLPQKQNVNFDNRPQIIKPVETKLPVEKDPRFAQFDEMRREAFKRAVSSATKKTINANESRSAAIAPPPPSNSSYQEKMNYYAQMQARLQQQTAGEPNAQYQAKLAIAKNMIAHLNDTSSSDKNSMTQNIKSETATDWQLHNSLEASKELTINTGFVIPAIMISGINSDLAGSIIAQVSQNVYDTATGRFLLIPQGTKLFGKYSSQIQFGQERVLVAWNRLIYPDGRTLDIGQMLGADVGGYSGFSDQVNNHYWKLFKGAFLLSMITASVTYADNKYNTGDSESRSATSAMSESLGQNLGDVSVELVRKHMNVSPTLEIRNGYRFNVVVTKDISFTKPYKFQE